MSISREDFHLLHNDFAIDCASRLEEFVRRIVVGERIDRVTARAKSPERFMAKAQKKNDDGTPKYPHPLVEIQDIIGVRVILFYLEDVDRVKNKINSWVRSIEDRSVSPSDDRAFSYFGHHSVMYIPNECRVECELAEDVKFFELQIKTMFQHAWSEAEHDILYKPQNGAVTSQHKRLTGFAASLAWGADKAFQDVLSSLES